MKIGLALQVNGDKLILAGISPNLRDQLQRTGMLHLIREENVFLATGTIGEAGNIAPQAPTDWLAESSTESDTSRNNSPVTG